MAKRTQDPSPTARDAIALLTDDHEEVRQLFEQYQEFADDTSAGRLCAAVAARLHRPFLDVDAEIESREGPIPELFERGAFRELEERAALEALAMPPGVIALGGGAVETKAIREALRERATTVLVEVDVETAWQRVSGSDRPLAQDEARFRQLYERRQPLYEEVADGRAHDADDVVLAAGGVTVSAMPRDLVPGPGPVELVADERVLELHPPPVEARLLTVPPGQALTHTLFLSVGSTAAPLNKLPAGTVGPVTAGASHELPASVVRYTRSPPPPAPWETKCIVR